MELFGAQRVDRRDFIQLLPYRGGGIHRVRGTIARMVTHRKIHNMPRQQCLEPILQICGFCLGTTTATTMKGSSWSHGEYQVPSADHELEVCELLQNSRQHERLGSSWHSMPHTRSSRNGASASNRIILPHMSRVETRGGSIESGWMPKEARQKTQELPFLKVAQARSSHRESAPQSWISYVTMDSLNLL